MKSNINLSVIEHFKKNEYALEYAYVEWVKRDEKKY